MENPSSSNSKLMEILAPTPLQMMSPSSDQSSSSTQNVFAYTSSSVTPLRNNRMYDPKLNRLTAVKRLARNRRKTYPKYGPYPCQWCTHILPSSQSFAGHMRAHYRRIETATNKAAQQAQKQQHLTPEQQRAKAQAKALVNGRARARRALANARARARAELVKARAQAEKLARLLALINEKAEAQAVPPVPPAWPKPRAQAPVPAEAPVPAPAPTPAPVASGSGKQPLRTNDVHLRLSNSQFGLIISPGDKNNSVSMDRVSNALDFLYSNKRRSIIQSSSSVNFGHHYLQVPPDFASCSWSRPSVAVVKQEVFPDEDVKPPPGFHHLLSEGPHGRMFIIKEKKVKFDDDDDDVMACGPLDNLALKL